MPGVLKWYRTHLDSARRQTTTFGKGWVWAEMGCMTASWIAGLALLITGLLNQASMQFPAWWTDYVLPVGVAAGVGYFTNFVAVTMLFRPYRANDHHWTRFITLGIWKRGLVPGRKEVLANSIGEQVANHLLTPEALAQEIRAFIEQAFEDEGLHRELKAFIQPVLRSKMASMVESLTPEIMGILRDSVSKGFNRDNLERLFQSVIEPWLQNPQNMRRFVDITIDFLKEATPKILSLLQEAAERYKSKGIEKRLALWLAEQVGALDWEEVREVIEVSVTNPRMRQEIIRFINEMVERLKNAFVDHQSDDFISELRDRTGEYVEGIVKQLLSEQLPDFGAQLVDSPGFWQWLTEEGLPAMRPYLLDWLEKKGVDIIRERLDIAGRVEKAVMEMRIDDIHEMVNQVSAEHLGAIQVLGYLFGAVAGLFLLLI